MSVSSDSIGELNEYVQQQFAELKAADDRIELHDDVRPPFTKWEADWFMRGYREGLFRGAVAGILGPASVTRGPTLVKRSGAPLDGHFLQTIGVAGGPVRSLNREAVVHLAATAQLAYGYHHPVACLRSEWEGFMVDIVSFDRSPTPVDELHPARIILGVEAKVKANEIEQLVTGMTRCRGLGGETAHTEHARNHHRKCSWLASRRAPTFAVASPAGWRVFSVEFPGPGTFELTSADTGELERTRVEGRAAD